MKRLIPVIIASLLLTGCPERPPEVPDAQQPEAPLTPESITRAYAEQLPPGTHGLLVARGFSGVAEALDSFKPIIEPVFDLGIIENEVLNTFGLDVARHVTFEESGIVYDAGFGLTMVDQQPVLSFRLRDSDEFLTRVDTVAQQHPFNLRAPVEVTTLGEGVAHSYASHRTGRVMLVALAVRDFAFLIARGIESDDDSPRAVAEAIAGHDGSDTPAAHPDFDRALAQFEGYPGFAFFDTGAAAAYYFAEHATGMRSSVRASLAYVERALRSVAAGGQFDSQTLTFDLQVYMQADEAAAWAAAMDTDTPPADFALTITDATLGGLRLAMHVGPLRELIRRFQSDSASENFDEEITVAEAIFPVVTIEKLQEILSGNALIVLNRLAPLSLGIADTTHDYADAVGLTALLQVTDSTATSELLLRSSVGDDSWLLPADDPSGPYTARNPNEDFGLLALRGELAVWTTERGLRQFDRAASPSSQPSSQPTSQPDAADAADEDPIRLLATEAGVSGMFLRFAPLRPIALILNWPRAARDALGVLDEMSFQMEANDDGLWLTGRLELLAPE